MFCFLPSFLYDVLPLPIVASLIAAAVYAAPALPLQRAREGSGPRPVRSSRSA